MAQLTTKNTSGQENECDHRPQEKRIRWFFVFMASLLLVVVFVGFAPSFYLNGTLKPTPSTSKPNVPLYIVIHGIVLSLWFLLLFTQAVLVATKNLKIHRILGVAGALIATILVPLGLLVVTRSVSRSNLGALPVLGDYCLLTLFATMVALAIRFRNKPDVHKRLILIASIAITAPALARWPGAESFVPISVIGPQLVMIAAIMVHDVITRRRIHRATGWGAAAYLVAVGIAVPLATSEFGQNLVKSLK